MIVKKKIGLTSLVHVQVSFCSCGCVFVLADDDFLDLEFFDALFSIALSSLNESIFFLQKSNKWGLNYFPILKAHMSCFAKVGAP